MLALAATLHWLTTAESCRDQETRFWIPFQTLHRWRVPTMKAIVKGLNNIRFPSNEEECATESRKWADLCPEFGKCLSAIDGTFIPIVVPVDLQDRFRNRKGYTSFNVLIAANVAAMITFIFPGVEGRASDGKVLLFSRLREQIPEGFFVLADAGYALTNDVLTRFRGCRYHLKEFAAGAAAPRNAEELYNLIHARCRM